MLLAKRDYGTIRWVVLIAVLERFVHWEGRTGQESECYRSAVLLMVNFCSQQMARSSK